MTLESLPAIPFSRKNHLTLQWCERRNVNHMCMHCLQADLHLSSLSEDNNEAEILHVQELKRLLPISIDWHKYKKWALTVKRWITPKSLPNPSSFPNAGQEMHEAIVIAICSPNCVQIGKDIDRKTFFCRVRHKKCWAKGETFFYVKPWKKTVFWSKPFYMRTKFWEHITFFVDTAFF